MADEQLDEASAIDSDDDDAVPAAPFAEDSHPDDTSSADDDEAIAEDALLELLLALENALPVNTRFDSLRSVCVRFRDASARSEFSNAPVPGCPLLTAASCL